MPSWVRTDLKGPVMPCWGPGIPGTSSWDAKAWAPAAAWWLLPPPSPLAALEAATGGLPAQPSVATRLTKW